MFPDFLYIGSPRTGSTWLYKNLEKHNGVWMPPIKEIHYFNEKELDVGTSLFHRAFDDSCWLNRRWRRLLKEFLRQKTRNPTTITRQSSQWHYRYFFSDRSPDWYSTLFDQRGTRVSGDMTAGYSILSRSTINEIHDLMPNTKLISILRNPIDRSWSHALKRIRDRGQTLEEADEKDLWKYLRSDDCRRLGLYTQHLDNWKHYFPSSRLFVGFFEDIIEYPRELIEDIFDFLGLPPSQIRSDKNVFRKFNASMNNGRIPEKYLLFLAELFHDELHELQKRYGGRASTWHDQASRLLTGQRTAQSL